MNPLVIAWLISSPPLLLVGFAFGFAAGRERERGRWLGRWRTCRNCSGWGRIRTGLPLVGMAWTCPDCHGRGSIREASQGRWSGVGP